MPSASKKYAVIAFVPAIHVGYINFFKKYPGKLYVLGKDFINEFPHMERDLRTPEFGDLKKMLEPVGCFSEITELNRRSIKKLPRELRIVMPSDEITKEISKKYLKGRKVIFDSVFLRWNKLISSTEMQINPDRKITGRTFDRELMKKVMQEATKSPDWWRMIGALIVKKDKILFGAYNKRLPTSFNLDAFGDPRSNFNAGEFFELVTSIHAEAYLVAKAAEKGVSLKDASVYVTTFPCPVCAKLLAMSGIKKVYYSKGYSLLDAESILKTSNIEIILVK